MDASVGQQAAVHRSVVTLVGAEPVGSTPAELGRIVREQIDKVRPLVAELKLVVQ